MPDCHSHKQQEPGWTRRQFLWGLGIGAAGLACISTLLGRRIFAKQHAETYIASVPDYGRDISKAIRSGLQELGISPTLIKGKRILLKPNLVETHPGSIHINTHPLVLRAAAENFRALGAAEVLVAEGPGHCRDSLLLLEESGLSDVLLKEKIRFVDLNYQQTYSLPNTAGFSKLKTLNLPTLLRDVDWIVSMAKMKTHHWAGVTLSMKNLFGLMPGSCYGWPKNVLHRAGISQSIVDIYASVRPHFAIIDGIVGMEGDGPFMGTPRPDGVLVMGRNSPAVDATSARIMGINPRKVDYLVAAEGSLGTIRTADIQQRGETIASVRTEFQLLDKIPALKRIRS